MLQHIISLPIKSKRFRDNLNIRCHIAVDALLSLARLYFDIYIGFLALSCERSIDQAPCRHLLLYHTILSLSVAQGDSFSQFLSCSERPIVPDIERGRLKEQILTVGTCWNR
jgi:hypothetical protein